MVYHQASSIISHETYLSSGLRTEELVGVIVGVAAILSVCYIVILKKEACSNCCKRPRQESQQSEDVSQNHGKSRPPPVINIDNCTINIQQINQEGPSGNEFQGNRLKGSGCYGLDAIEYNPDCYGDE